MNVFRKQYRELSTEEKARLEQLKDKAQELHDIFENSITSTDHREIALAKTKLEEAVMWAVKGITG